MKDYDALASAILTYTGGERNILSLEHCSTRLRFKIKDMAAINRAKLEDLPEVVGVRDQDGGIQVVIGTDVDEVYRAINAQASFKDTGEAVHGESEEPKNPVVRFMNLLADCFVPLIPALIASGLMSAVVTVIEMFGLMDTESVNYQILEFMGEAPLYFIPFMLAVTASRRFKVNTFLTMAVVATLLYPSLSTLGGDAEYLTVFGLPMRVCDYSNAIVPVLLCVFFQVYVERLFKRVIPKCVATFLEPLLTYVVLMVATLFVLGPIATWISDGLALVLNNVVGGQFKWLVCAVLGALMIPLISTGLHYSLMPVVIAYFTMNGYDTFWGGTSFCANLGLAGAVLGFAFATKSAKGKELAGSSGITALLGITEPAIYGIAFPHRHVLLITCVAGGIGGFLSGLLGVNSYGMAPAGLSSIAVLAGPTFLNAMLAIVVSFAIGLVGSFLATKRLEASSSDEMASEGAE